MNKFIYKLYLVLPMKRVRRTYMLERSSINLLKGIKKDKILLANRGLYLKSESDIVNYAIVKLDELLKKSGG